MEILIIIVWLLLCCLAVKIAEGKGRSGLKAFLLAFFLSPLVGILVAVLLSPNSAQVRSQKLATGTLKQCPYCAELIQRAASVCPHCRKELFTASAAAAPKAKRRAASFNVAKNGADLGPMSIGQIRSQVAKGELDTIEDHYFDTELNEWTPLGVLVD